MRIIVIPFLICIISCTSKTIEGPSDNGSRYVCECNDKGFNGVCNFYDSSGHHSGFINYIDGIAQGEFKQYYSDGTLKESGSYSNNKTEYSTNYDKNGVVTWQYHFYNKWIVYRYYKDTTVFIKRYKTYDSISSNMNVDSTLYFIDYKNVKYKYDNHQGKMYKCFGHDCSEMNDIGANEDEFIQMILGKDTSLLYYYPTPFPQQKWYN